MAEEIQSGGPVPPPGEPIHLPDPSYLPVLVAAGTTLALVGVVINAAMLIIGLFITLVALVRWIRLTRAEIAELPLEHDH